MKNGYQPKDDDKPLYPPTTGSRVYSPKYDEPMTFQEAYKIIQDDIKIYARKNGKDVPDLLFVASVAIEKQIPKKPIKNEYGYFYCATCKGDEDCLMYDSNYEDRYNYCHNCGQRLDWSGEV